ASLETAVQEALEIAAERARRLGRPVLASVVTALGEVPRRGLWAAAAREEAARERRVLLAAPDGEPALVGLGVAWSLAASGPDRFEAVRAAFEHVAAEAVCLGEASVPGTGMVATGAFRFDPERPPGAGWEGVADADLFIPRLLLTWPGPSETAYLTINIPAAPQGDGHGLAAQALACAWDLVRAARGASDGAAGSAGSDSTAWETPQQLPDPAGDGARWTELVGLAVQAIRQGRFHKVVLARAEEVLAPGPLRLPGLVGALAQSCPACARFLLTLPGRGGGGWWLGATPERLVTCRADGTLRALALAGSAPRAPSADADAALARSLMASPKQQAEHRWVVDAVRRALEPLVTALEVPERPGVLRLPDVQHLCTPITGRLRPGRSVTDVVKALHPTPAVGGFPREAALRWLRAHEGFDRGWYAAPVGWWDAYGNGDFWVGIRSARLLADPGPGAPVRATLYAGCGIVADSRPEDEWAESTLKLRPMRRLLAQVGLLQEAGARRAAV
ncbi:MAG TPA: isochorismate synthase, partial [Limnochordales bacterium]